MKRSKKSRVSWPPGPMLCQVKMFRTEDCPAKVADQPQRQSYKKKATGKPDVPPGFEGNNYADKLNLSTIPRIKWKRPPKFLVSNTWLIGDGGESTERRTENLRISKVLEAIYPHRSTIPSRPSVSPVVEAESFHDSKTPAIRLTPIEDELESAEEPSLEESNTTANKEGGPLETKPRCSSQELVSGLAPDLSLAASAALTALMKTKEQGSMIDADLLIKFLSDPKTIKNLISTGKSSETEKKHHIDTNINLTRAVPQHVSTVLPMATKPQLVTVPQEQSFVASSQPFTNHEQRRVSPPKPLNGNPRNIPIPVHSSVGIAKEQQPLPPPRLPSSSLPMSLNLQRPQSVFTEPKVIVNSQPQHQLQPSYAFRTSGMNNVQASIGFGRGHQTGYPMNLNRVDASSRPKPVVQPMKSVDYFKNLIREHGTVNHETNQCHSQTGKINGSIDQTKVQKQCIYFGTARGCKLGDSCVYVHDHRLRPNFDAEAPMAKRIKFGRYEKNGF
uniref:Zinc finger CCCH domain-containing protein 45 n=1 Tax=Noccaea caerulescens TaxID=107243 RepID=A0A1J3FEQ5_NOCCA